MDTLVIFYSLEGNTKRIAEVLAKELHADLLELKTKKVYPSSGFKKYVWGGKSVMFREQPALANEAIDLAPYNRVVIGTPIWAGTYAAPYQTFLKQYRFSGKQVAFFVCHAGGGTEKCFRMMKEALPDNDFIGEMDFVDPLKNNPEENLAKAVEWAKKLKIGTAASK